MTRRPVIRRLAILAAVAATTLAACGTTDVGTSAAPDTAAPASRSCADDRTATATGPVTITDGVGRKVELATPATRVAVLEWQQIEDTLTLCVTPVAVADKSGYGTYVSAEKIPDGVVDVGTREQPDLDALYATNPDLIIVEAFTADDEKLTQLQQRGVPVLATLGANAADPIGNMKGVFTMIAQATGRTERADVVLQQFDAHLAEAKQKVSAVALPTKDFLFFDGWIEGGNVAIRPYGKGALFTALGEQLGMTPAWTDAIDKAYGSGGVDPAYGLAQTDIEGLTAVGSANLFYSNDDTADSYVTELQKSSIWTSLPAVKEGRAHAFPPGVWGAGGPLSNEQAIDAYVAAITGKG
ncbi:ABC transporter substrate-binding protein [Pseudonocardia sulfidoxydans NBRC 16205]|uniref:ABC transporter substrate-binding protein n=1 Tax=Pseudonocardia sulfidoxydans NBRC 16205 TaxID=1223511 RepID=A0A511DC34_9PSEU|nr:iron-siderophore ABC transporter substrate-binding protein [Pseudonocardia sulfidoxydans]GEL22360.1 ABC transporter substrate-binding protein [Pseudonocardia sulfidoxydans NBRC 16205]